MLEIVHVYTLYEKNEIHTSHSASLCYPACHFRARVSTIHAPKSKDSNFGHRLSRLNGLKGKKWLKVRHCGSSGYQRIMKLKPSKKTSKILRI